MRSNLTLIAGAALLAAWLPSSAASVTPTGRTASPTSGANVWLDPDGGACVRLASPGSYADARACGSLQAAYNVARSGDTVNIVDGTYSSQGLTAGSKTISFQSAGPGRPRFGQIVSAASNIVVRGIQIENRANFDGPCLDPDNAVLYPCGTNQTFDNVIIDGLNKGGNSHGIRGVGPKFVLRNSEIRNLVNVKGFEGGEDDIVIENNYWHDIIVNDSSVHNECMYVDGGNRAVYRGNRFIDCPTMALAFTNWNGGPTYRDVLVENNVFTHTLTASGTWHPSCAFKIGSGYNGQNTLYGWVVRYNTFENAPCVDDLPAGGSEWYGNLGGIACVAAFTYRNNVGETCGGIGEVRVRPAVNTRESPNQTPFYLNAPAGDFRLKPRSAAIGRGDRVRYPRSDARGRPRPIGAAPDAGAFEYVPLLKVTLAGSGTGIYQGRGRSAEQSQSLGYSWRGTFTFELPAAALKSPRSARFRVTADGTLTGSWRGTLRGSGARGRYTCTYRGSGVSAQPSASLRTTGRGTIEVILNARGAGFFSPIGDNASAACTGTVGRSGPPHFSPKALFRETVLDHGVRTTRSAVFVMPSTVLANRVGKRPWPDVARRTATGAGGVTWTNHGSVSVRARLS